MLRYLLILSISFCSVNLYANRNKIDSLTLQLKKASYQQKAEIYIALSEEFAFISNDTSRLYAEKTIAIAKKLENDFLISKSYISLAVVDKNEGKYPESLERYLSALKIADRLNDEQLLMTIYNGIGIIYKRMRRWDEALVYYTKANELAIRNKEWNAVSYTFNNIGTIHLQKENWDAVTDNYDSAIYYAEISGNKRAMATVLSNLGDLYREQKRYSLALNTFKECLRYDKENEDKYGMFMSYFQIARVYAENKDYKQSLKYFDSAEILTFEENLKRERVDLYGWRTNMEEGRNRYPEALRYNKLSHLVNDTIISEQTSYNISELQTKYETEKKEQEIKLQQSEISKRNYVIGGISLLFLLGGLLGVSGYNRYRLKQKARLQQEVIRQQELATQAVIEAEENERKRIAGDLHDGVGQTMSAAKMNLSVIYDDIPFSNEEQRLAFDKAMALVDEGCKEVRSVSHNIMPNALLKSGLANAIGEFLNKIDSKVLKVSYYAEGLDERLPSNTETVLYRVVQECVNNVIKHAEASSLDITLIKDDDDISITIEDNGKGFDKSKAEYFKGIGLQNMLTRVKYLKGTIDWDTAPGRGTVVTIDVPTTA